MGLPRPKSNPSQDGERPELKHLSRGRKRNQTRWGFRSEDLE